ncbi:unnamed protein product [Closterium sp. NIES-54]
MLGEGEQRSFMVVYVDDILIFSPSSDLVKEVMLKLQDKFKCKALGDVSFYLGHHIERDVEKRCMRVHQRKYLEALAANFGQSEGHVATPFPSGFKCVKGPEEESVGEEERRRFHSLVGSLMYAAVNTRPDVAFAIGQLARVVQCPNEKQVAAGMRLAKYLGQTATVGLQFSAAAQRRQKGADGVEPGRLFLTAFSDASYASEPEDMTSVGGFICCVGGGPTAWESKKQVDQALSSVESEYMALFRAGPAPSGVSQVDAVEPVEVAGDSGAAEGAELGGADSGGAERVGAESGGAEPGGAEPGGAGPAGTVPGGSPATGAGGAAGTGGSVAAEGVGATGPGGARTGSTGAAGPAGTSDAGAVAGVGADSIGAVGPGGGPAGGTTGAAGGTGAGATTGAGAIPAVSGVVARPRPYFIPLLQQVLGLPSSTGPSPPLECPQPVPSPLQLQPASPLPAPSPYTGPTGGLAERREPASRPASPARAARTSGRGSRQRPPPVRGMHRMSLRPCTTPLRAPLPSPPESPLPALADPESDSLHAASPTVTRLLATVVTDPSFESTAASALVAELVDFAARCRLDCAASLVAESASVCPPSVGGECALGTDVLEDRQEEFQCLAAASPHLVSVLLTPEGDLDALDIPTPRSYAEAIEGPYSSQWQATMDSEMASWKSTGTYVDEVPPPGANIVSGMWIFRVKRPPGSPPVFKARYVARGFSQRQGVDYFQTFSPTPKMTTLRVLLHIAAQRDYELHSLDFSTAFLQGSLHEEIWLRRPPGFTGSFPPGTQWSLQRPVYGLCHAPREWHDTLRTTLAALGFAPSTADPSLFLRTNTSLPPFYILVYVDDLVFATADTAGLAHVKSELQKRHACTDLVTHGAACPSELRLHVLQATPLPTRHLLPALPSDESVESSGPYPELVGCLMYLMTCTQPDLAYPLSILARYVAPGRHRPEHMAAAKRVLRYLCSTSGMGLVLGGRSPVVLTGHADASWADDQAMQRSSQGYTFSLGSGSVSWRATLSSSVLGSSCEAEIYAGAMAAQELRWLTYLLTDFGEVPRSPPVLYVDNKAMLALCREQRLEHRTKHIALRYFLACELQQRGQLRLAYVASEANTADVFTKALAPSSASPASNPPAAPAASSPPASGPPAASAAREPPASGSPAAPVRIIVSLFDHTSGAAPAPPATADSGTRTQWLTRDAATCLAIRNHLPLAKCAHFKQHRTTQALYDAVVARYSLQATAALGCLLLPYLFPELSAFATVEYLVSHLRTSDARYRAALPAEFLAKNPPPMYITLYFIVTRLPDSLRAVRGHFLALDPTALTVGVLKQHLLAAETSVVAVGAARGTPHTPFFEGCSPSPLAPSYASAAAANVPGTADVGAASASAKRRSSKGKGDRGGGGGSGGGGRGSSGGGGVSGGGGSGGSGGESGGFCGGSGGSGGGGGSGSGGSGGGRTRAQRGGSGGGQSAEGVCYLCVPPDPDIEAAALGASESVLLGTAPAEALHTFTLESGASRCFFCNNSTLTPLSAPVLVRLADPSESPVLARSSTLLPCPAVPSGSLSGLHLPSFSTILVSTAALQDAMVTTTTPGGQRVSICTCTRTGRHLATFTCRPGSSLHTLATEPPQVAAYAQVSASGQVAPPCSSLLPLPTLPATPCLPFFEGRQRAAPHSSFPSTTAPLQILHIDVWGPARVTGQGRERYILLVVDDYTRHGGLSYHHDPCGCSPFFVAVRDASADKLSARTIRCVFLGFPPDAPGWQFYHPTSRHVIPSHDVMFDESVPFYRLFPYRSAPPPPPLLFLVLGPPPVDPLPGTVPVEVAVGSGAAPRAASRGVVCSETAVSGGAELGGGESDGAGSGGAGPWGAEPGGAELVGVEPGVTTSGDSAARDTRGGGAGVTAGAGGTAGAAAAGPGGTRTRGTGAAGTGGVEGAGAGDPMEPGAAGAGEARAVGARAGVTSAGGAGAGGAGAVDPGAGGTGARGARAGGAGAVDPGDGGTVRPRPQPPHCMLLLLTLSRPAVLQSVVSLRHVQPPLFALVLAFLVRALLLSPAHTLRPSSASLRVPLPPPLESTLPSVPDPESDRARATRPTVSRLLATIVTGPSFDSTPAFALLAELVDFAAACRLDYATALFF